MQTKQMSNQLSDLFWRFVPVTAAVTLASLVLASQVVQPHRRMIKASVMLAAVIIMLRF